MDKKSVLEMVKVSLDHGASIDVRFHNFRSKEEAENMISEISEMVEEPYKEGSWEGSQWLKIENYAKGLNITVFYDNPDGYMVEDIDLSGNNELHEIMLEDVRSEEYVSSFDLNKGVGL